MPKSHLNLSDSCAEVVALYEKSFDEKVDEIMRQCNYDADLILQAQKAAELRDNEDRA
ncbi:MAG: hypothetical protein FWB91_11090 [Defluviitaleaceae bacterium]|nr:hypothetical protein [Defluviitaleaceae bacterium]